MCWSQFLACWQSFLFQICVVVFLFLCFLVEFIVLCCLFDVWLLLLFVCCLFCCCCCFLLLFGGGVVALLCYQRILDPESIELLQNPADTTLMHYDYTDRGVWARGG